MHAGLLFGGHTVPVARVHASATIDELTVAHTTISFSYITDSPVSDALFKAQLNPVLGRLNGVTVTVGTKQTTGSFISSEKASELYGKDTLDSQHIFSNEDDKEWLLCHLGEVENNSSISITISFVKELLFSSDSLLFTLPAVHWLNTKDEICYALDVDITVKSTSSITVSSPTHPTTTITEADKQTQVHLSTEVKNEDFSLAITPASTHSSYIVEKNSSENRDSSYAILLSLFQTAATPAHVEVNWGGLNVRQTPQHISSSKHVVVYASLSEAPRATVTVTATGEAPFQHTLTESNERVGSLVHQLVACSRIRELEETSGPSSKTEIRDLAVQAGISTLYSSVFAKSGGIALVSVRPPALKISQPVTSPLLTAEGVVSPTSGRKVYDSKFLLSFREHFTDMPEGLPPIDIILGKGGVSTPTTKPKHERKRRQPPPALPPVEPLKQTEGRWMRPSGDAAAILVLQRNVLGLLNKLTVERFDALSTQFTALKITSVEDLAEVCKWVFEKAIAEQHFCNMYADLCKKLAEAYPSFRVQEGTQVVTQTFKRLLLNMCQKEFECAPPVPQEGQDKLEADDLELKYRRRTLGNIRFIGELFKLGLLRGAIMHECVTRLLVPTRTTAVAAANGTPTTQNGTPAATPNGTAQNGTQPLPTEEDLEALCKLLQTIGKRLDAPGPERQKVDRYFSIIASLSRNHDLPSRNRFMLMDLIDLRKSEWIPRRVEGGPKTIAAVHADAEKADRLAKEETALRESGGHRFSNPYMRGSGGIERDGKENRNRGDRSDRSDRADGRDGRGEDSDSKGSLKASGESVEKDNGWEVVGKPAKGGASDKWEVAGSKNKRGGFQEVKGGRRDSFKTPQTGGRGNANNRDSRGKDKEKEKDNKKKGDKSREQPTRKPAPVKEKEKERAPPKSNVFSSLDAMDEDDEGSSSGGSTAPTPRSGNTTPKANVTSSSLTPAQLEARTDALLVEYFSLLDTAEAVECIKELKSPEYHPQIVVRGILLVLERNKPNQLEQLDALFAAAFGSEPEALSAGFEEILETIEDLDIDIPMASRHVATLIGSFVSRGTLPFSFLFEVLSHLVESGKAEVMVGAALQKILKESGETKLLEMYDSSQHNVKELFKSGREGFIDTFLKSKDLAFLAERLS